jgi:lysophospholipase L1-like esterase
MKNQWRFLSDKSFMHVQKKITGAVLLALLLCSFSLQKKRSLNIVFIGDSITYGAGHADPGREAPPVHASDYLRQQKEVGNVAFSNQGVSGYTTVDFLPATGTVFKNVEKAAGIFQKDAHGLLLFSIMLGTNDSAEKGPHGSPVAPSAYRENLKVIADRLLRDYPGCKVIFQYPIWYSPNTYNGAKYLQAGLTRLQSYFPEIDDLVAAYAGTYPGRVYKGDRQAFGYFKSHHLAEFQAESGHQGTFYLHPNRQGAIKLGGFWGTAIYKALFKKQDRK